MRALVAEGADVNQGIPLKGALMNSQAAAVQWLLEHGADANARERNGWSPLHAAAVRGDHEILGLLLAAGADANAFFLEQSALTMLSVANHVVTNLEGCRICAKLLLSHGARVDGGGPGHCAPLYTAIDYGRRDLVKIFLRAGARAPAIADLPLRSFVNDSTFEVLDAVRAAGGWPEYVAAHRGLLAGLVAKLSAVPLDAAGHIVAFYCPPGGF